MQYDNDFTGVLFKNNRRTNDKQPSYRGSCQIAGNEFEMSGWIRTSKKTGEAFISLALKPKEEAEEVVAAATTEGQEVPF